MSPWLPGKRKNLNEGKNVFKNNQDGERAERDWPEAYIYLASHAVVLGDSY